MNSSLQSTCLTDSSGSCMNDHGDEGQSTSGDRNDICQSTITEPDDPNNLIEHHHESSPFNSNSSTSQNLKNYINSGPMSEGHVRLSTKESHPEDPTHYLCLFTSCLFIVGLCVLSFGLLLAINTSLVIVSVVFIVCGSFSASSAALYSLVYCCMYSARKSRTNQKQLCQTSARTNTSTLVVETPDTMNNSRMENQFSNIVNPKQLMRNGSVDRINEGSGLCGSSYVPPLKESLQLNVDNLNCLEIKSTENIDANIWKTINGEPPQSYLESFGDLPPVLSSPSFNAGRENLDENQQSSKRSKARNLLGSFSKLGNGQSFLSKNYCKTNSQTELLDEEENENTLFHVKTIGNKELEDGSSSAYKYKSSSQEEITLIEGSTTAGQNASMIVHFNRNRDISQSNNNLMNSL